MTMVETGTGEVEEAGHSNSRANAVSGGELVLPEEVVRELAAGLAARAREGGEVRLAGPGGLLAGVIGQVLQAGLSAELDTHLGYGPGDRSGAGSSNSRNGVNRRTIQTEAGPVTLEVPRDRAGTFEPVLVPKGARRTSGLSDQVISLYAGGMSVRDISRHLERGLGVQLSHDTVSKITDGVLEEVKTWQHRPLDPVYPVMFIDAMVAKVRDGGSVRSKAVNIAIGVDLEGVKHVLGIWVAGAEGAKPWAQALAQVRNRGVADVLIVCCDGLSGLGEEIVATWPQATVQTCGASDPGGQPVCLLSGS